MSCALQFIFLIAVAAVISSSLAIKSYAAEIDGVRIWRAPDSTRLVFDLSGPTEHKLFTLKNPARVVIDITHTELKKGLGDLEIKDTPISKIRYGAQAQGTLRVVLDMKTDFTPRSFSLLKHGDKPHRLVIDLYDASTPTAVKTMATVTAPANTAPSNTAPSTTAPSTTATTVRTVEVKPAALPSVATKEAPHDRRDIIIAIDAGHGGEDPGAIGPQKLREKDVVLAIARHMATLVNATPGYKAKLIRDGDYYIALGARRNKARDLRADLFVSIHADAFKNPKARGASVFALSRHGATSETARFLATKENDADLIGGVGGVSLNDKDDVLAGVLVDLSMTATLSNSLQVGASVLGQMGRIAQLHKKHVEQAGFMVLKSPDVPSILVETGFISNPQEAAKLATTSYRQFMAKAIFDGVQKYFNAQPPAGTLVAWNVMNNRSSLPSEYTIARGDTLSGIAKRHSVSVKRLVEYNRLNNASIRIGQTIKIPAET
ncbi:MAG: N-acetylmuramoyl-L-alanine amidase [Marinagarivorans sp.]|nr:N-acetylmuramoyl-L-alanine amidase [Marinagarivorans sp.]